MAATAQPVRDSAGIRVVENARPLLGAARAWRVDPVPAFTIGGDPAATDSLNDMLLVMGVTRLSDGRFAIGVQGASTVRFYDGTGKYLGHAGRKGQGPGEFQQVMGVRAMQGDTLAVTDLGELEYFAPDGKFVRQGASRARGDRFVYPAAVLPDGSYLGTQYDRSGPPPAAGRSRSRMPLVHVTRDGAALDTVTWILMPEQQFDGRMPEGRAVAFSTGSAFAADARRVFVGATDRFEIHEMDLRGRVVRVIRLPGRPARVNDEAIQAYRNWIQEMPGEDGRPMPPAMKARFAQMLERTVYAESFPPFGVLRVDRGGNLWAQRFHYYSIMYTPGPVRTQTMRVPSQWDVFDPDGRWLCAVDLPARFTPVDIGDDYVAGVGRDADDVEQVRVYRLRR